MKAQTCLTLIAYLLTSNFAGATCRPAQEGERVIQFEQHDTVTGRLRLNRVARDKAHRAISIVLDSEQPIAMNVNNDGKVCLFKSITLMLGESDIEPNEELLRNAKALLRKRATVVVSGHIGVDQNSNDELGNALMTRVELREKKNGD